MIFSLTGFLLCLGAVVLGSLLCVSRSVAARKAAKRKAHEFECRLDVMLKDDAALSEANTPEGLAFVPEPVVEARPFRRPLVVGPLPPVPAQPFDGAVKVREALELLAASLDEEARANAEPKAV